MTLFFITSRYPWPLEKGDKLRAFELIKQFSKYYDVVLFALHEKRFSPQHYQALAPYCKAIYMEPLPLLSRMKNLARAMFNTRPFQVNYFYTEAIQLKVAEAIAETCPSLIYCHLIRMSEYVKHEDVPKVLDYMDVLSVGMERFAGKWRGVFKLFAQWESKRLRLYEEAIQHSFSHSFIISKQDADLLPVTDRKKLSIVPNGIDAEYFHPAADGEEKVYDLVFAGNMNYTPNIESARYIVEQILPASAVLNLKLKVALAGAEPAAEVKRLASGNVTVTGWVDDIRPFFWQSHIMVAPMLINTGLQNKILQAMAMKIPCIISTMANNAIGAVDGEQVLLADSPEEYALAIKRLMEDGTLKQRIVDAAHAMVIEKYSWPAIVSMLEKQHLSALSL